MTTLVIVGAQWGDEGKGKIVDLLTAGAGAVVRYGGGANAGHTLVVDGEKVIFHLVPSAALHVGPRCLLGPGMVIDPEVLVSELETLDGRGLLPAGRVVVSECAHVVLPHHVAIDTLREKGPGAIGTTKRGIGPCYEDRAARRGIRVGDLLLPERLEARLNACLEAWQPVAAALGGELPAAAPVLKRALELGAILAPHVGDVTAAVHEARDAGARVVLEGAQGTMLDIDHGTYPFVTSSSVTAGGACTGSGIGPTHVDRVLGITKAYTTRVGDGPFPTELDGDEGESLRQKGGEFGATTGRPRRCGWLDIPVLRHAIRVNGLTELALTKLDVLSGVGPLQLCVGYRQSGRQLDFPPALGLEGVEPIYETLEGWDEDLRLCRAVEDLPLAARAYIERIEALIGCSITLLSVGPDRRETIVVRDPWR